ncbi:ankyrin repeat domain-containing protein [Candidatus Dojkabacteria bacterium]|jgi:ankyrin repeat protein|nr:ankyrin repeat domain-containing protein [Candidatus Dojkabacteria bacterium]
MKYIKKFIENGTTFIQKISELENLDKPKDINRILRMIDDNPQYVNYIRNSYYIITSPINETILRLSNKHFVTKILIKLIENGADVNLIANGYNASPLYNAVTTDKLDIVKVLVENGSNLEVCSGRVDTTPLMLAIMRYKNGNRFAMSIIEYLIEKGANWFYYKSNLIIDIKDILDAETYNKLIEKYQKQYQNSLVKQKAKKYNI